MRRQPITAGAKRGARPRVWVPVYPAPVARAIALWIAAASALAFAACGPTAAGERADAVGQKSAAPAAGSLPQPRQFVVLLDLSASQTPRMLADAQHFLGRLVNGLRFGDRIVLLEVHQSGVRDDARRWADTVPRLPDPSFVSSRDRARLEGAREAARSVAQVFFDSTTAGMAQHTDLFATLHVAAEYVRGSGGRETVLVLLSDMLQSARGIEMEGLRRMPTAGWIDAQQAAGVLPALDGACVLVVGADASTAAGAAVRDFWLAYFEAAGAGLRQEDYRLLTTGTAAIECGGGGS